MKNAIVAVKDFARSKGGKAIMLTDAMVVSALAVPAVTFASESGSSNSEYTDVTNALVTGLTSVKGAVMDSFKSIIPIALVIMGALLAVRYAIHAFRTAAGR